MYIIGAASHEIEIASTSRSTFSRQHPWGTLGNVLIGAIEALDKTMSPFVTFARTEILRNGEQEIFPSVVHWPFLSRVDDRDKARRFSLYGAFWNTQEIRSPVRSRSCTHLQHANNYPGENQDPIRDSATSRYQLTEDICF